MSSLRMRGRFMGSPDRFSGYTPEELPCERADYSREPPQLDPLPAVQP